MCRTVAFLVINRIKSVFESAVALAVGAFDKEIFLDRLDQTLIQRRPNEFGSMTARKDYTSPITESHNKTHLA